MTQPWDWIHNPGNAGYSPFNLRDAVESAGVIGMGAVYTPGNVLCAQPFFVGDNGLLVRRMGVVLSNASAPGSVRLGIYACPPYTAHDMWPTNKVADFGELVVSGAVRRYTADASAGSIELAPGYYYAASLWSQASNTYGQIQFGGPGNPLGVSDGRQIMALAVPRLYGLGLPDTFPSITPGFFGVIKYAEAFPASYRSWEITSNSRVLINVNYNAARAAGTAAIITDTTTTVTVEHGNNTLASTVNAAFLTAANITGSALRTADGLLVNSSGWVTAVYSTLVANGLRARVNSDGQYNPFIAIDPEA